MKLQLLMTAGLVCTFSLMALPADARISKQLSEELNGHVEALGEESDTEAREALVMLRGLLNGKDHKAALDEALESDTRQVRLAARLVAFEKKPKQKHEELMVELLGDASLERTLTERGSVLQPAAETALLEALLKSSKPEARVAVAKYASNWHEGSAPLEVFTDMLTSTDKDLRKTAVDAALNARNPELQSAAQKMMASKKEDVRVDAVRVARALTLRLAPMPDAQAILEQALEDSSAKVWKPAALRLVELRKRVGATRLIEGLSTMEEAERLETLEFLVEHQIRPESSQIAKITEFETENLNERILRFRLAALTQDSELVKKLIAWESSTDYDERQLAVQTLGFTGSSKAVPVLVKTLFERRKEMRLASAQGLQILGSKTAIPQLQKALRGERDKTVKIEIIRALGKTKAPEALRALRFLVTDRDRAIKEATLRAVGDLGLEDGVAAIEILHRDRDAEIQWLAFLTAFQLKPDAGVARIDSALRNPPGDYVQDIAALEAPVRKQILTYMLEKAGGTVQSNAIRFVMKNGGDFTEILKRLVVSSDLAAGDRRALMLHFASRTPDAATPLLERLVRTAPEKPLKRLATWLLVRSPDDNLEPSFRGYLGIGDPAIRAISAYGLGKIHR